MAKKKDVNIDELDDESGKSGKLVSILVAMLIIVIWLVIFALLIKMNVGGIGSSLRPYLKNVPVVNKILPAATDEEIQEETGGKYKSLSEAVDRIKELEAQLDENNNNGNASAQTIAELQAEIARLKVFEENAQHYQELKDKFDTDVVASDEELAAELEITIDELADWQGKMKASNLISLDEYTEAGSEVKMESVGNSHFDQPEEAIEKEELKKMMVRAIDSLTEKERSVVVLYYYEDMTLKEISLTLEVSESRVSQLHTKALNKMKKILGDYVFSL